jgi:hypothetical protein
MTGIYETKNHSVHISIDATTYGFNIMDLWPNMPYYALDCVFVLLFPFESLLAKRLPHLVIVHLLKLS